MENEKENVIENGLDVFMDEIRTRISKQEGDKYLELFKKGKTSHIEDHLYDQIIIYMGDKETERVGTKEDIIDIVILGFLIWLRKQP